MNIGITLMVVGMVTVFVVLLIIINLSKLLIKIVNKVAPEEEAAPKKVASAAKAAPAIAADVMEVIRQTVSQVTGGKGVVANVVKL